MDVSYLLDSLNDKQRDAVAASRTNLLVLAGAGSGKTRVLVHRIAWLQSVENASPYSIMAVTFTNKAAAEMRHRIAQLMGTSQGGMWVGTFHGLAHRLLRAHHLDANLPQDFQILDSEDQLRLLKRLIKAMNLDEKQWPPRQAMWYINSQKDEGLRPHHIQSFGNPVEQTWQKVYQAYQEACDRAGLVDFAELLLRAYKDGAYDLVVPSTYFVDKMRKEGMIQKIDKTKFTNFANLDPEMLNKPFDPNNDYSIPYIWGATAIGVNRDEMDPKTVTSWADLWKPEYKGSLLLTDDAREVFQMALRKLGYSGNTTDPKEIEAAYNELKKLMPNVAAFNSDNPANPYMEGEVNVGMVWNGSAYVARQAGTPLEVVWPKEGGIFWMDSLSIPANAKNVDGAMKLINFLLRPDVAKEVAETIGYPTPNLAARKLLSPEVANDKSLYPDAETISKGEWQNDVGDASRIYEDYSQKLKAGR
jgi:spermidine/putrescine transport system substrate-binding protein